MEGAFLGSACRLQRALLEHFPGGRNRGERRGDIPDPGAELLDGHGCCRRRRRRGVMLKGALLWMIGIPIPIIIILLLIF
ncbi:hypothetical protein [Salinarimonas chemoclinalis]|uniref:hypothetical protein n=1 Tax=Salinarimonas chemoclinalis TaxID=3241599 RepID=UPI003556F791